MLTTQITDNSHPFYENIYRLYHSSFPVEERRDWVDIELILNTDKRFNMFVFSSENEFSGFLTFWEFENFVYVEHFAVSSSIRGQGIGSQIMKSFMDAKHSPIILEVELPETPEAIKRIAFYEKLGFVVIHKPYLQPPYDGKTHFLPLLIMSSDKDFGNKNFGQIRETLYKEVYKTQEKLAHRK